MTTEDAEPTELAGTAEADTQSAYAWGLAEPVSDDAPQRSWITPTRITVAAVTVSLIAVIGVAAFAGYTMAPKQTDAAPAAPGIAQAPPLDGAYKLVYDATKTTINGTPQPGPDSNTTHWAFRTQCDQTGCTAAGVALDNDNPSVARVPAKTAAFRFIDGRWREDPQPERYDQPVCLDKDTIGPGQQTNLNSWIFEPLSETVLHGTQHTITVSDECGFRGTVVDLPVTVTRIGDRPDISFPAPDPKPASPNVWPGELDGLYNVTLAGRNQTVNGNPVNATSSPDVKQMWAFRSACTSNGCSAVAAQVSNENVQQNTGVTIVLDFVQGQWENIPAPQTGRPCPNGPDSDAMALNWALTKQQDGTLRGSAIGRVLTDQCGHKDNVYKTPFTAVRTGEVPAAAVIADPAMFIAS